ncbi:MAG: 6-bladed beta-propeller [Bacteroidales bacterium]|nr:6-bladed beta-propeller [Bacteroidales bacterium]
MKPQSDLRPTKSLTALLIVLFTFIISCNEVDKQREFASISFTPDQFIEMENVLLDTIVDNIEYVMLESGPDSYIGRISALHVTNDEILIISESEVFIFDRNGRFKIKLGAGGRGPEEYLSPLDVIYSDGKYIVYDSRTILMFDSDYQFIKKTEYDRSLKGIKPLGNNIYVGELSTESFYGDSVVYSLAFYDEEMNVLDKLETTESTDPVEGNLFVIDIMGSLNHGTNGVMFREEYGDTIYSITSDMERIPVLKLDMGNKKYPKELNFNMAMFQERRNDYIQPGKFAILDDIVVLQFLFNGNSMYSWIDIRNDKTIIPVINNEDKFYRFALSAFPGYPGRTYFANGFLFGIIQPSEVMEYFDQNAEGIPADQKTKLENITIDHNPVLMLGTY